MRYIIIILLCIMAMTACSQGVKLTQIEKSATKWHIPIAKRVIPGQSGFFMTYMPFQGYLDSIAWTPFTLTTTGTSGAATFNTGTKVLNIPNYSYRMGYVTQSGTGAGVISYLSNDQYINFINGSNITISRASGTNNVTISATGSSGTVTSVSSSAGDGISTSVTNPTTTPNISITNTKPFDLIYTQANSGSYGGLYNGGILNLSGSGGTTVSRSGNTFTISSSSGSGTVTSVGVTSGNGISASVSNPTTTPNISITNSKPFDYIGVQAGAGAVGTISNAGTLNLTGSGGTTVTRSGGTFTISSTSGGSQNLNFELESGSDTYLNISGGVGVNFRQGTGIDLVRTASNVLTVNNSGVSSISAGSGISVSGSTGAVTVSHYKEYASAYNSAQSITTSYSDIMLTDGGISNNMTVSSISDAITPSTSGPFRWTVYGTIYNSSTTPTNVTVCLLRGGTTFGHECQQVTARDTHTPFSMSGYSNNGTTTFKWKIQAGSAPAGTLDLYGFQATVEKL